jgi:ketosteroid isomerase-like protein
VDDTAANRFATQWAQHWNSHDLEGLLSHFSDDVLWTSPVAAQIVDGSDGVLRGKVALRDYYAEGLRRTRNCTSRWSACTKG